MLVKTIPQVPISLKSFADNKCHIYDSWIYEEKIDEIH